MYQYLNRTLYFCSHHEHGAVSIYESEQITIKNCTFENNTSDGSFTNKSFLGSSGGISIGYNSLNTPLTSGRFMPPTPIILHILIINCTFSNNSALYLNKKRFSSTEAVQNKLFYGRGGALSLLVSIRHSLKFIFNDSTVINNFADAFGGGMYCLIQTHSNQTYTFGNNVFMNNRGSASGGMAFIYQYIPIESQFAIYNLVYNCKFYNNTAEHEVAGAVGIYSVLGLDNTSYITFKHCKFHNNTAVYYGGAVDIESSDFFVNIETVSLVRFTNWLVLL